jgi:hypothetical protein
MYNSSLNWPLTNSKWVTFKIINWYQPSGISNPSPYPYAESTTYNIISIQVKYQIKMDVLIFIQFTPTLMNIQWWLVSSCKSPRHVSELQPTPMVSQVRHKYLLYNMFDADFMPSLAPLQTRIWTASVRLLATGSKKEISQPRPQEPYKGMFLKHHEVEDHLIEAENVKYRFDRRRWTFETKNRHFSQSPVDAH